MEYQNQGMNEKMNDESVSVKMDQLIGALDHSSKTIKRDQSLRVNFIKGIYAGLGATLGIAALFAVVGFIIRALGGLPIVGSWLIWIGQYLHK